MTTTISASNLRQQTEAIASIQGGRGTTVKLLDRAIATIEASELSQPLTFTKEQWQLIAAACAVTARKPSSLIGGEEKAPLLKAIALQIAKETGKEST